MARAGSEPGDLLEATSREIDDVQAQIDRLSDQAAAAAVDADTVREIGASHRKLHCKLLEEKQSELLEAQISRPDDETLMHALKSVTAELAAAKITVEVTSDKSTDDAHTRSTSPRTPSQRWGSVRQLATSTTGSPMDPQFAALAEQMRRARADAAVLERSEAADTSWRSRKTKRMDALRVGRDRTGHGWVSWQIPLSFLLSLMSATWSLCASLDSFAGQRKCEGIAGQLKIDCETFTFAELLEHNRTSVLVQHEGQGDADSATHPGTINAGFIMLSTIGVVALLVIAHSARVHADLKHKTINIAADNKASLRKFAVVFLVQVASFVGYWVLGDRAKTVYPLLPVLHEEQDVRNSNFDPDTAAAYAYAAQWTSGLAAFLFFYPALGQYRRLYGWGHRRKQHIKALNRDKFGSQVKSAGTDTDTTTDCETALFPVERETIDRRKHQIMLFCAAWLYLLMGAFFYWLTANEEFTTVAQAVYFACVTITTIGYGDMSPSTSIGQVVLILYSFVGIGVMGAMLRQLGELLLTASEAPAYWLMHVVVIRVNPSYFPGFSAQIWRDHGINTDFIADNITGNTKRKLWVGNIPSSLASTEILTDAFSKLGAVGKVTLPDLEQDRTMDPESRWALITMRKPEERQQGEKQKKKEKKNIDFIAMITGAEEKKNNDFIAMIAERTDDPIIGQDGVLLVLPAQPVLVCRHMLATGAVSLGRLQVGMAVCLWLAVLLGIGPFYGMQTHAWSWGESVYFTFITMSTIGYGDYYPNDKRAKYSSTADAKHHQVFVWCMGVVLIVFALSSFSFVFATVQDIISEQRDHQEKAALARDRAEHLCFAHEYGEQKAKAAETKAREEAKSVEKKSHEKAKAAKSARTENLPEQKVCQKRNNAADTEEAPDGHPEASQARP